MMIKGASMFSSAGIAETYFKKASIDIVVANELLPKRGEFYSKMYPTSNMIVGDIRKTKDKFIDLIDDEVEFLIATPPCQGLSTLGMNKHLTQMQSDPRNYLVFDIMEALVNGGFLSRELDIENLRKINIKRVSKAKETLNDATI